MSGPLLRTTVRTGSHLYRIGAATTPLLPPFPVWNNKTGEFVEIGNVNSENFMRGEVRGCNLFSEPVWAGRRRHVWRTKSTELLLPAGLSIARATDTPFAAMQTIVCAENQTITHKDYLGALTDMEDQFVLCKNDELRTELEKHNLTIPEVADMAEHNDGSFGYEKFPKGDLVLCAVWGRCQDWYRGRVVLSPSEEPNDIPLMELMLRFVRSNRSWIPDMEFEHFFVASPQSVFFSNSPVVADRLIPQWMPFLRAATSEQYTRMLDKYNHLLVRMDEKWPHYDLLLNQNGYDSENVHAYRYCLKAVLERTQSVA